MNYFIDTAWAQVGGGQSDPFLSFLPLIIIFALFYFLLIRPQTKRKKEHDHMVQTLETGQEIVTGGGVLGKITDVGEQFVTVEVTDGVSLKVQKHTVAAVLPKGTIKSS